MMFIRFLRLLYVRLCFCSIGKRFKEVIKHFCRHLSIFFAIKFGSSTTQFSFLSNNRLLCAMQSSIGQTNHSVLMPIILFDNCLWINFPHKESLCVFDKCDAHHPLNRPVLGCHKSICHDAQLI